LLVGVLEGVRRPVRHREDLVSVTTAPVLGEIARDRALKRRLPAFDADDLGPRAESVRFLRANLGLLGPSDTSRFLLVTSARPGEGRTSVALSLAMTMSHTARKTLLIDADLRSPSINDVGGPGLSAVLRGTAALEDATRRLRDTALSVLPGGDVPENPGELLASERMSRLLADALTGYDVVIIDTPPLLQVADAATLAALTGDALLVTRVGRTRRRDLQAAIERLDSAGAVVRGVVLNDVSRSSRAGAGAGAPPPSAAAKAAGRGAHTASPGRSQEADGTGRRAEDAAVR
jgi:succinoglycan biosynthesis transport protein ExoP